MCLQSHFSFAWLFVLILLGSAAPTLRAQDTTAPSIYIVPPPNHAIIHDTATIEVVARDDVAVVRVELFALGRPIGSSDQQPFSIFWDTAGFPEGPLEIVAAARDAAGNVGTGRTNVWVIPGEVSSVGRATDIGGERTLR